MKTVSEFVEKLYKMLSLIIFTFKSYVKSTEAPKTR